MSGYLDVKYPFKSNLGLNPFKTWKRQWCILRPSPTSFCCGSLAVYCSEAGAAAGTVELSANCVIRWAKSRTRPHAFAVFTAEEPRKPRILLAAPTLQDAQVWMDKIRALLNEVKLPGIGTLLSDSYSVTVMATEFSRKCGLCGMDSVLMLSSSGLHLSRLQQLGTVIDWTHVVDVQLTSQNADKSRTCLIVIDRKHSKGGGELKLSSPIASNLVTALKKVLKNNVRIQNTKKLSKSDGDLNLLKGSRSEMGEPRSNSWYSVPSHVSFDDTDLIMLKDVKRVPSGPLSRYAATSTLHHATVLPLSATSLDDSTSDRRSLQSLASGIYEEIPELPLTQTDEVDSSQNSTNNLESPPEKTPMVVDKTPIVSENKTSEICDKIPEEPTLDSEYCTMGRDSRLAQLGAKTELLKKLEEPTYESVADCIYATMRRPMKKYPPPPLPPRLPFGTMKMGESWNSRINQAPDNSVTRHSSLGSLPRCCSVGCGPPTDTFIKTRTLPKSEKPKQPFNVFRKRLKSDSRIASLKSETVINVETKKKKFDFTPTRDIFKNFRVGRKMKNLKISGGLSKVGETKSCEFLDETEHIPSNRCSKSFECLEDNFIDENDGTDLSIEFNDDAVAALQLPQEIVDIIFRQNQYNKIRLKESESESKYIPMSPIVPPPPMEQHYLIMSPKTNLA